MRNALGSKGSTLAPLYKDGAWEIMHKSILPIDIPKILFSPDSSLYCHSTQKNNVMVFRSDNGNVCATIEHSTDVLDYCFNGKGTLFASTGNRIGSILLQNSPIF